jgi:hypothetical protein
MTTMITDLVEHISFRGEKLTLVWKDEEPFVALRPVCERLGLDWKSQYAKVTAADFGAVVVMNTTTGADGKRYEMLCLHVMDVPFWLATLTPSRVKPELAEAVRLYRTECKMVLFQHWKERLLGERAATASVASRVAAELISRKPLWVRVERLAKDGMTLHQIWRAVNRPHHMVVEAVGDLYRLGFIPSLPEGMPFPQPVKPLVFDQMSLFGDA